MKQQKLSLIIAILVLLLIWSVALNLLQCGQVDNLTKELNELEDAQSQLSTRITEVECAVEEGDGY